MWIDVSFCKKLIADKVEKTMNRSEDNMNIKGYKISVDAGHTKDGTKDSGAVGIGNEHKMNIEVKNFVIKKLQALGATVNDCSLENCNSLIQSLAYRTDTSNTFKAQLHICIHHNAFNGQGHGSEVEYVSTRGKIFADAVQKEFVKLGFKDRGVQERDNLYVLNKTNAVCVLTEACFVDNKADMLLYNAEKEAQAIVNGIVNVIGK
jgi:N-acetylmuramoyl-L-alanine amidase